MLRSLRSWIGPAAPFFGLLVLLVQLQRGTADAHHNFDAPLTIEAPFDLLPCDLALWAYPAVLDDRREDAIRAMVAGASVPRGEIPLEAARGCRWTLASPDAPRPPPTSR